MDTLQLPGGMQRLTIHDLCPHFWVWLHKFRCSNQVRIAHVCSLSSLKYVPVCSCFTDVNFTKFVCWNEGIIDHHFASLSKCRVSNWNPNHAESDGKTLWRPSMASAKAGAGFWHFHSFCVDGCVSCEWIRNGSKKQTLINFVDLSLSWQGVNPSLTMKGWCWFRRILPCALW